MQSNSSDRLLTVFVAVLGIAMIAWGYYRVANPPKFENNSVIPPGMEKKKKKGSGGGMMGA